MNLQESVWIFLMIKSGIRTNGCPVIPFPLGMERCIDALERLLTKRMRTELVVELVVDFLSELVVDFLYDAAIFPDDFLKELREKSRGHNHQFSSIGHFRCEFPIHKLLDYYELESNISNRKKEINSIENRLNEREKELSSLESILREVEEQITNLDVIKKSKKKKILSLAHRDETREIEDQKTEVLQRRKDIDQEIEQTRERITCLKQKKTEIKQGIRYLNPQKD